MVAGDSSEMDPTEKERLLIELTRQLGPALEKAGVDPANLEDFATHGEWGLALDTLLWALDEHAVVITPEQYAEIASLGAAMQMDPSGWQRINAQGLVQKPGGHEA